MDASEFPVIDIRSLGTETFDALNFWVRLYGKPLPLIHRCPKSYRDYPAGKGHRGIPSATWMPLENVKARGAIILWREFFWIPLAYQIVALYHELAHYRLGHHLKRGPLISVREKLLDRSAEREARRTYRKYLEQVKRSHGIGT